MCDFVPEGDTVMKNMNHRLSLESLCSINVSDKLDSRVHADLEGLQRLTKTTDRG